MTLAGDLRALGAGIRKEWRVMRRYPTLIPSLLFWPVLLPAVWIVMGQAYSGGNAAAMAAFAARSGTGEIAGFVFVGYSMYMWLSTLLWNAGTSVRMEQVRGTLEAVFLSPASRLVPLFAPALANIVPASLNFVAMGAALWLLFGVVPPFDAALRALVVILVGVPAMLAIGSLFAAAVLRMGEIGPAVQLVRGTFVLACGVTFPVAMLPLWAQATALALPPTYIVDDIRRVLLRGQTLGDVGGDLVLVVALAACIGAIAVIAFRVLETGARRTGMLGRY